jgi:hypothetical protein
MVLYNKQTQEVHCLNQAAVFVWENADGTRSIEALARLVELELNVACGRDVVLLALDQLSKAHLLEANAQIPSEESISRRLVGKKLAMAGMSAAMLPLVASMMAPSAKAANSGVPNPTLSQLQTEAQDTYSLVAPYASSTSPTSAETLALTDYRAGEAIYSADKSSGQPTNSPQAQTDFENAYTALTTPLPSNWP